MLEIGMHDVVKNYGFAPILSGASLEIMTGERVALVGRNGSGKSTILKILAGDEPVNAGRVIRSRGASVGYLTQIPALQATDVCTRDVLMAPFEGIGDIESRLRALEADMAAESDPAALERLMRSYAHWQGAFEAQDGYAVEERFARISQGFGLMELLDRPFNALSGGQKTIVQLACVMLRQPDILLLDEPTNHLDVRTLAWFEASLAKYAGTVLVVSHDRYFLDRVAQKTILLEAGACKVYHGNYTYTLAEQERELLAEFEQYKNQQKQIDAMKAAIRRFREWGDVSNDKRHFIKAKQLELRLEKMEMIARPELSKPKIPIQFSGGRDFSRNPSYGAKSSVSRPGGRISQEVLRLRRLTLSIGGQPLLEDMTLTIRAKDRVCLLGDNGTGKTTLLRAILGQWSVPEGTLYVAESACIGYIPQEIRFEEETASVLDAFRTAHPMPEGNARSILAKAFFVGDLVRKRVGSLSGGEKVLLMLTMLLQRKINFLVLDEPTNHIDIDTREILEEALLSFTGTILFVSHDRYFIQRLATRILAIEDGRMENYDGDWSYYQALQEI